MAQRYHALVDIGDFEVGPQRFDDGSHQIVGLKMPEVVLARQFDLLVLADAARKAANGRLSDEARTSLGQYMTSASVASFMASLFPTPPNKNIRLLDPGAGVGSLTSAFVDYVCQGETAHSIEVDTYEIDSVLIPYLESNLHLCETIADQYGISMKSRVISRDFIIRVSQQLASRDSLWPEGHDTYTHRIMNPPYKKIPSSSRHRRCLSTVGIETVNLYSAFVALSLLLLVEGGYLVVIMPRSFCNGPYFRPFREFLLSRAALRRIHLFDSRNKAFREDKVLQENIILALEKGGLQGEVAVSTSADDSFSDISISKFPFREIVREDDRELFIHVPSSPEQACFSDGKVFVHSLAELGVQVSTGPVVDYRLKDHLRALPEEGMVPLLYPCHFKGQSVRWPAEGGKKPNAILCNNETQKWLYPNGFYTVVRRFSSKEERRRIVPGIVDPTVFPEAKDIGLENHLNVFHSNKLPLPEDLARGLFVFLRWTPVDNYFRRFSGHTQVNATDLRLLKYPSRAILIGLGQWASKQGELDQEMIDDKIAWETEVWVADAPTHVIHFNGSRFLGPY